MVRNVWMSVALLAAAAAAAEDDWQRQYAVGDRVQLKINDALWQDCTVSDNPPGGLTRLDCTPFVEAPPGTYTRAGGTYIAYGAAEVRRAGSDVASPAPPARAAPGAPAPVDAGRPAAAPAGTVSGLRPGEYACYGSGGRLLAGFGFTAAADGSYRDLDGAGSGRYVVEGSSVRFVGGHMDGTVGRELANGRFRIGQQADCEPF